MKNIFQRLRRWHLRRFRGYVEAPRDRFGVSRGTDWQEHPFITPRSMTFRCRCHQVHTFTDKDYFVRHRQHVDNCPAIFEDSGAIRCECPITDARYVRICPACKLGHWMDASPKGTR